MGAGIFLIRRRYTGWRFPKPGGFPTFFGKGPDYVADPFGNVPCRCFLSVSNRLRKRKGPIGKIQKKSGKDKKGQKRMDKSRSGT